MLKSFFASKPWILWAWGGLLLLGGSIVIEVQMLVWLNGWYREMWDFLQNPDPSIAEALANDHAQWTDELTATATSNIDNFWRLFNTFLLIVFPFIGLRAFSSFFARHYAFRWRQAITFAYMPLWKTIDREIEGASQRLQQDPERFARLVEQLGLGLFRSLLTLIAFIPILWMVSNEIMERFQAAAALQDAPFSLPLFSWTATTPGSLVLVAVILALGGTALSFLVGIRLPGLEYNNQRVEARFRKRLVYSEDDKSYAQMHSLVELFTGLRFNYFRLYLHYSYFALWAGLFGQFLIVADLMLIGTGVVLGIVTFGFMSQIANAFSRVSDSLTYFVDNWTTVTELLSVIKRLREFERNIGYAGKPLTEAESAQLL